MVTFQDLPNDLLQIIINYLSTSDKFCMRESCKINNALINYMDIKIDIFNKKFNSAMISFRISDNITKHITLGIITEWQAQFCWSKYHNRLRKRTSQKSKKYIINESINEVGKEFASVWLYDAVLNWSITEQNRL